MNHFDEQQHAIVNGVLQDVKDMKKGDTCFCATCHQNLSQHFMTKTGNIKLQHYPNQAHLCIDTKKDSYHYVRLFEDRCKHAGRHLVWICSTPECENELLGSKKFYKRKGFCSKLKKRILKATSNNTYSIKAVEGAMEPSCCMSCVATKEEIKRVRSERDDLDKLEAARAETERLEAARADNERLKAARADNERLEAARSETKRLEAARADNEKLEAARADNERLEAARAETERLEAAGAETERLEAAGADNEKLEAAGRVKMAYERRSDEFKERSEGAKRERQQEIAEAMMHKNKRKVNSITNYFTRK